MNFVIMDYNTVLYFMCPEFHYITKIGKMLLNFIIAKNK